MKIENKDDVFYWVMTALVEGVIGFNELINLSTAEEFVQQRGKAAADEYRVALCYEFAELKDYVENNLIPYNDDYLVVDDEVTVRMFCFYAKNLALETCVSPKYADWDALKDWADTVVMLARAVFYQDSDTFDRHALHAL